MNVVTWNVNSLRTFTGGLKRILDDLNADIACFQETKLSYEQLTEELALVDGYFSYYSFCKTRSGYSGVATYCKKELQPFQAEDSLADRKLDESIEPFSLSDGEIKELDEGRTVITHHLLSDSVEGKDILSIVNAYCPCVTGAREGRDEFRTKFLQLLQEKILQLRKISHVILLGDLNISHRTIDHFDPGDIEEFTTASHRVWMDKLVVDKHNQDGIFIDSFRHLHPTKTRAFTCWDQLTFARQVNNGTRIDYILLDENLLSQLRAAQLHTKYIGSDHCPVSATIDLRITASQTVPFLCTNNRFRVRQKKLTNFFMKKSESGHKDPFSGIENTDRKRSHQTKISTFTKKPKT